MNVETMVGNNKPLVSVIIPMYNAENFIGDTIKSVIKQTYNNLEIIIVDDCSTDNSINIVKQFQNLDSRIKLIQSKENFGGPARPRNIGIKNSSGEYIAFLDADDIWLPEKIEKQINFLLKHPHIDIVHSLAYTINAYGEEIGKLNNQRIYKILKYFCDDLTILYFSNYININTALMKKDINIFFREDKYLIALEDWMFWIENVFNGKKVFLLNEYLIKYRIVLNSISNRTTDKGYRKAYVLYAILLYEKKISFLKFIFSNILNTIRLTMKHVYF